MPPIPSLRAIGKGDQGQKRPMRTVVRNIVWLLMSHVVSWSLSIGMLIATPRVLGTASFGQLELAGSFVGFFGLAAALGTRTYLIKTTARNESLVGHIALNALVFNIAWASLMGVAAFCLARVLGYSASVIPLIAIYSLTMVVTTADIATNASFHGLQQMGFPAFSAVLQELVFTALAVLVLWQGWGVRWFAATYTAGFAVQLVANLVRFRPFFRGARVEFAVWRAIVRGGLPFFVSGAVLVIYGTIDIPLLEHFADDRTVAWYAVAYKWVSLPVFFTAIVMTAVMPSLSASGQSDTSKFVTQANKALCVVFAVAAPIATGLAVVAKGLLISLYGERFTRSVAIMQILAVHLPIMSITMIIGTTLIASDRQRAWVWIGCVAAVFNIGVNVLVIPWSVRHFDNGAIGAALVTVATEFLVMLGAVRLRPAGVLDRRVVLFCFRCLVACALMIPPVLAIEGAWLGYQVALGAAIFGVASMVLRIATPSDLRRGLGEARRSLGSSS